MIRKSGGNQLAGIEFNVLELNFVFVLLYRRIIRRRHQRECEEESELEFAIIPIEFSVRRIRPAQTRSAGRSATRHANALPPGKA